MSFKKITVKPIFNKNKINASTKFTANGIHDIKLIGENEQERLFIKQLAEAGTLSCVSGELPTLFYLDLSR
jgi:hypothetical protein